MSEKPRAIAIVGAREGRVYTETLPRNLRAYGYAGKIWPISRSATTIAGLPAYPSLAALPFAPDVVFLAVNPENCIAAIREAVRMGVGEIVVYANGFAETGTSDGVRLQAELVEAARGRVRVLGPNSLGFVDLAAGICALTCPIPLNFRHGPVSVLSHSGSLISTIMIGAASDNLGLDWCVALGNGAAYGLLDAIEDALDRDTTELICGYLEGLGGPEQIQRLGGLLEKGSSSGRQFVFLKAGASPRGARLALSHTASIAGNARLAEEFLDNHGVIRVDTPDDLARTLTVLNAIRRAPRQPTTRGGQGVAVIEPSGGAGVLTSDLAARSGMRLAKFAPATYDQLASVAGSGSFIDNPIDLTAASRPEEDIRNAFRAVYEDPGVGCVLVPWSVLLPDSSHARRYHRGTLQRHIDLARASGTALLISTVVTHPLSDWVEAIRPELPPHTAILQGLASTVRALARVFPEEHTPVHPQRPATQPGVLEEAASIALLQGAGVTFARTAAVRAGSPAGERISGLRPPLAVKLDAAGVAHKAALGGVRLGCLTPTDVDAAATEIRDAAVAAGLAPEQVRGVLVQEMVFGREVLVGLSRDPLYGPNLALGLGGALTEVAGTHAVVLLPEAATARTVAVASAVRRLERVLGPVSAELAELLERLATEFVQGSLTRFATVELNPLVLTHEAMIAVDAVAIEMEGPR